LPSDSIFASRPCFSFPAHPSRQPPSAPSTACRVRAAGIVEGSAEDLAAGATVYLDEKITTGADARLAVTFADGTALAIGEKANITLDQFVYAAGGANKFHATVIGAFRFISGSSHNATREASITTAVATIGIRGTDFWGGPIDNAAGVVLLDGAVTVTTAGGSIDLDAANSGVDIAGPTLTVTNWTEDKRRRALSTVSFR
jgi:hypothetical protein